mgnify:CR=1 FL=1
MSVPGKNSGSRQRQVFLLRLPHPLKEQLKQQAKANHRSLNAEILVRLEAELGCPTAQNP